jgi:hypothetical protein
LPERYDLAPILPALGVDVVVTGLRRPPNLLRAGVAIEKTPAKLFRNDIVLASNEDGERTMVILQLFL